MPKSDLMPIHPVSASHVQRRFQVWEFQVKFDTVLSDGSTLAMYLHVADYYFAYLVALLLEELDHSMMPKSISSSAFN
jgi:hypothetical protein